MTTTTDTSQPEYTVVIAMELENQLDECFSPADGIEAINQLHGQLPKLHRSARRHRLLPGWTRMYRARYDWTSVGFTYVEVNGLLHVILIWNDQDTWSQNSHHPYSAVLGEVAE